VWGHKQKCFIWVSTIYCSIVGDPQEWWSISKACSLKANGACCLFIWVLRCAIATHPIKIGLEAGPRHKTKSNVRCS
jgi:hypothetical protein